MNLETMIQGNPQALVTTYNGVLVADSLQVAEQFGKRHHDVMNSIENLINQIAQYDGDIGERNFSFSSVDSYFIQTSYTSKQGKILRKFFLTRDGFSLLVMGFTGPAALHWKLLYIEAFNKMEEQLRKEKPQPDITALVTQITTQVIQTLLPEIRKTVEPPALSEPKLEKKEVTLDDLPSILTVYDIRDFLHIGQRQAYELVHSQDFPTIRVGSRLLVQKTDFKEWLQRKKGYV